MQYGSPYFAQPFQQIQPYQDRLAQLQNSYQQAMPYGQAQIQQPIQQMPQVPQIPMLQGQMVDGIDTVDYHIWINMEIWLYYVVPITNLIMKDISK